MSNSGFSNPFSLSSATSSLTPQGQPEFVHLEEKYQCIVCHLALRDAMQTLCGHRLCEPCVPSLFASGEPVRCPANKEDCEMLSRTDINRDSSARREIRVLPVYCSFKQYGCTLKLPWRDLENHITTCNYRPVECVNRGLGCDAIVASVLLQHHIDNECQYKPQTCQHCGQTIAQIESTHHIQEVCPGVIIDCPFGCGVTQIPRRELSAHLEQCSKRPTPCKYNKVGCNFQGSQTEVNQHGQDSVAYHLELVTVYTAKLELQSVENKRLIQELMSERESGRGSDEQRKENEELKRMVETMKTAIKELKIKLVSQTERIIKMERLMDTFPKKEAVERNARDLAVVQGTQAQLITRMSEVESGGTGAAGGSSVSSQLVSHDKTLGLHDVRLAEMDLRFQVLETISYNGELLWKIKDYDRRKHEAVTGRTLSLYSQPFYLSRYGQKMCARVYLNGDGIGRGTHLSIFFVIMKGEYDALLKWPFSHKVEFLLMNQVNSSAPMIDSFIPDPNSSSFKKPTSDMNIASGCPLFIKQTDLESPSSPYLKDQTLFIKIVVDSSRSRFP